MGKRRSWPVPPVRTPAAARWAVGQGLLPRDAALLPYAPAWAVPLLEAVVRATTVTDPSDRMNGYLAGVLRAAQVDDQLRGELLAVAGMGGYVKVVTRMVGLACEQGVGAQLREPSCGVLWSAGLQVGAGDSCYRPVVRQAVSARGWTAVLACGHLGTWPLTKTVPAKRRRCPVCWRMRRQLAHQASQAAPKRRVRDRRQRGGG